jgi:hypothetical protein
VSDKKELNIYQKLVEVRESIDGFKKDATGYGYMYVSGSQVLSSIKAKMDELGIILEPHLINPISKRITDIPTIGKEVKTVYFVDAEMKMIWVNADKPEDRFEVSWYMTGEQKDPSQAFGSGLTYSERYFLLKFFNVPTDEDDPDNPGKPKKVLPTSSSKNTATVGNSQKLVTDKQLKRYFAMVKEAGLDIDKSDECLKKKYGVEHKKDLTMAQIDEVFAGLDKRINENKEAEQIDAEYTEAEQKGLL